MDGRFNESGFQCESNMNVMMVMVSSFLNINKLSTFKQHGKQSTQQKGTCRGRRALIAKWIVRREIQGTKDTEENTW